MATITVVGRAPSNGRDFFYEQPVNRWMLDDAPVLTVMLERTARLLDEEAGEACEVNRVILPTEMWEVEGGEVVKVHLPLYP